MRALTSRIKAIGAVVCERDVAKARARDAQLLADCGGVVPDTPRQDVMPRLEAGFLSAVQSSGCGCLFAQPRLADGLLMDQRLGNGWRLVLGTGLSPPAAEPGLTSISLGTPGTPGLHEADGVVAAWLARHACNAALLRPDNQVFGTASSHAGLALLLAERRSALGH